MPRRSKNTANVIVALSVLLIVAQLGAVRFGFSSRNALMASPIFISAAAWYLRSQRSRRFHESEEDEGGIPIPPDSFMKESQDSSAK